ncbi:hypothetical protein J0A68_12695 [Algoriphagus sp. H41]|uniref:Cytochrome c domain-containing protein n=1 Tax=Algoriphagus oliviformis TaxID=2811231 RepID=A0ABS3C3V9_9BACT|nr:DUF2231 domain-containing protein [Algoriphagus oliviformis]MBN7811808.1 hypothetical protein [Algoriphagus oliviformis]
MEDLGIFIGRFHPVWVHLPIGFLVLAVLLKGYVTLRKKPTLGDAVSFSLLLGVGSSLVAAVLGLLLSRSGGYEGELLDFHLAAGWVTVLLSALAWWTDRQQKRFCPALNYALLAGMMVSLVLTGHFGGSLTHGEDFLTAYAPFAPGGGESSGRVLASIEEAEVFGDVVQPILKRKCQSCHRAGKSKAGLDMSSYESLLKGGEGGPVILPSDAEKSELIRRVMLPEDHEDFMPAEGKKPLTAEEIQLITWWIAEGNTDPKILLSEADEDLIAWARPQLNIQGEEVPEVARIDTLQLRALEQMGFRIRVLSIETGALDVVLPEGRTQGQAAGLLEALMPIKDQIWWLSLAGTGVGDAEMGLTAQFSNLQRLRIENNPVTDAGISELRVLSRLEVLNLNGTAVNSQGLEAVAEIKSLKALYLWNTSVNPANEQVAKMRAREVKVVFGS